MIEARARPGGLRRRLGVLRHRNFALLWVGLVISNTGTWMQIMAQGWLVYELTDSPLMLGTVGAARAVPMIVLPFFGGVIADRMDRIRVLWITQIAAALLGLALAILTASGQIEVWQIIVLAFLASIVLAFDQPARQALLPALVPREDLRKAIALHAVVFTGGAFLGPAVAGLLAPSIGIAGVFFVNTASYLTVLLALALMNVARYAPPRRQGVWHSTLEGLRFVARHELVVVVVVVSAAASLFARSYQQLAPVFARDVLLADITGLGWLMSAPGVGALAGAFVVAAAPRLPRNGVLAASSLMGYLAALAVFALSTSFALSLAALAVAGLLNTAFSASVRTMLQLATPEEFHGRVMSLNTITFIGFTPLGALLLGSIAEAIGAPLATVAGVAVVTALFIVIWTRSRALRTAE